MQGLFEHSDYLTSPYEAFLFDTTKASYPVKNHWHYFCEILYVKEGTASIQCNEYHYAIDSGDFVFFHPQALHAIYGDTAAKFYVIKFDLALLKMTSSHMPGFQKIILSALGDKNAPIVIKAGNFDDGYLEHLFQIVRLMRKNTDTIYVSRPICLTY